MKAGIILDILGKVWGRVCFKSGSKSALFSFQLEECCHAYKIIQLHGRIFPNI